MAKPHPQFALAAVAPAALTSPAFAQDTVWQIDPAHSTAQFSVRHLAISNVKGEFDKVTGTVRLEEKDFTRSTVEVSIDAGSVNTREPQRDAHLRSADFFDVTNHPTMMFRSRRITPAGNGKFKMTGDLTIRGVTREVTFEVNGPTPKIKDPWGNTRFGASATARINRKDFGVLWNAALETRGVLVGDDVVIAIEVELIKKSEAPATTGGN